VESFLFLAKRALQYAEKTAPGSIEGNLHRNTIFNDKNLWGNQIEYCSLRMKRETDSLCMRGEARKIERKGKKHISRCIKFMFPFLLPSKAIEKKSNK
jgi:hypothetical protein